MFERFTDRARRVLVLAQEEARLLNHNFIGTEHVLLGLIHEREGIAAQALRELDVSLPAAREKVGETIGLAGTPPSGSPPFTPRAKKVLELSMRESIQLGHSYIGTEHLLLGIVREGQSVAAQVLVAMGVSLDRVRQHVGELLADGYGDVPRTGDPAWPGPSMGGFGRTTLVACSFCGLRPPESGQLVSGENAFICEHCIRQWSELLEAAPGPAREVTSRLYEGPPGWRSTQGPGAPPAGPSTQDMRAPTEDPSPPDPEVPPAAD
ncbi:MAG TPA: Clp protease N-terminal domain-containing protein [Acidimicrobiales bacterium]|nr:Clp protease N-terminal domain-containing protein [Acidimicrobiales bacterium]